MSFTISFNDRRLITLFIFPPQVYSYHDKRWVVSLLHQVHFDIFKYLNAEIDHKLISSYFTQRQTFVLEWTGKIY